MIRHPQRGSTAVRLMTAFVLIPIVLVLIWVPALRIGYVLFCAAIVTIGMREYFGMVRARGIEGDDAGGIVGGLILVAAGACARPEALGLGLALALILAMSFHLFRGKHTLPGMAATVFGIAYLAFFAAHFVALHRTDPQGPALVMLLLVAVGLSDTGAYFTGKTIGKHKLAPVVSPKKTVEGSIGGLVWAALGMALLWALRDYAGWHAMPPWTLTMYIGVGFVLAVAGQIGDLAESMLKRDTGIKDSGSIFPGHGGILDRVDGILFAAPLLYYIALIWK